MPAVVESMRRHWRPMLCVVAFVVVAAATLAGAGTAWLWMVPALCMLGRSRGGRPGPQAACGDAQYGVGAALAGFTPVRHD